MNLAASFDTSYINKAHQQFHNIQETKHDLFLKNDYALLRRHGFTLFRDSAYLTRTYMGKEIDWTYLDKLAEVSKQDIMVSLCHYEMPFMPNDTVKDMHRFVRFLEDFARRYKDVFHSYLPIVESGYWTHMITNDDWLPHIPGGWWKGWDHISELTNLISSTLKSVDPTCKIAMAEPVYWRDMDDNCRPFDTLLGKRDNTAIANDCLNYALGADSLLDIIGLNIYNKQDIRGLVMALKQRYPSKEIVITETNNNDSCQDIDVYLALLELELQDFTDIKVYWNPAVQMATFYDGSPISHGYLFDMNRKKCY